MTKLGKARRELLRVWHQGVDAVTAPLDDRRKRQHDATFTRRIRSWAGDRPATAKIALFLIHQPGRLAASILVTCAHLCDNGYAILLVSNSRLDDAGVDALRPLCWRMVERPNYGYDFGGYRDGVRILTEAGLDPDFLLILNDSVWFPTNPACRLLAAQEAQGLGYTGPVFVHTPEKRDNRHYQSFFLLVGRTGLQSPAFRDYWRDVRVSSEKRVVLKHGEKGFSQAMLRAGLGAPGPTTKDAVLAALAAQPNAVVRRTLAYASYRDAASLAEGAALLAAFAEDDGWRQSALGHIARTHRAASTMGMFVYATTHLLDLAFLKKRNVAAEFDGARWQYVRAVRNGDLPAPHPDIWAEILASRMDPGLTTDPSNPGRAAATQGA